MHEKMPPRGGIFLLFRIFHFFLAARLTLRAALTRRLRLTFFALLVVLLVVAIFVLSIHGVYSEANNAHPEVMGIPLRKSALPPLDASKQGAHEA